MAGRRQQQAFKLVLFAVLAQNLAKLSNGPGTHVPIKKAVQSNAAKPINASLETPRWRCRMQPESTYEISAGPRGVGCPIMHVLVPRTANPSVVSRMRGSKPWRQPLIHEPAASTCCSDISPFTIFESSLIRGSPSSWYHEYNGVVDYTPHALLRHRQDGHHYRRRIWFAAPLSLYPPNMAIY